MQIGAPLPAASPQRQVDGIPSPIVTTPELFVPPCLRGEARDGNRIDAVASAIGVTGCGDDGKERHSDNRFVHLGGQLEQGRGTFVNRAWVRLYLKGSPVAGIGSPRSPQSAGRPSLGSSMLTSGTISCSSGIGKNLNAYSGSVTNPFPHPTFAPRTTRQGAHHGSYSALGYLRAPTIGASFLFRPPMGMFSLLVLV